MIAQELTDFQKHFKSPMMKDNEMKQKKRATMRKLITDVAGLPRTGAAEREGGSGGAGEDNQ